MHISSLTLNNFRNYKNLSVSFIEEGAVFVGENGAGKTNILEAIHFLSLGRSQRGVAKKEMIHFEGREACIQGVFKDKEDALPHTVSIGFSRGRKMVLKKNKQKVPALSKLLFHHNIVSFGSSDIILIYGEPSERRRFIDTVLCQIDRDYFNNLNLYKRNLKQRNMLLKNGFSNTEMDIYEEKMAENGAEIFHSRQKFFTALSPLLTRCFNDISLKKAFGSIQYVPSVQSGKEGKNILKNVFCSRLKENREKDTLIGVTSIGPHRDDFRCFLNNKPIKVFGSQGQCRAMALSLRLGALGYLEENRPGRSIILVDDAFTELDKKRRERISALVGNRGQLFITAFSRQETVFSHLPIFIVKDNTVTAA